MTSRRSSRYRRELFWLVHTWAIPDAFNRDKRQTVNAFFVACRTWFGKAGDMSRHHHYQEGQFHIGKLIKAELLRQGRSITWLSLQVNCSRENLYKLFMRPWINTDLLFQISKALDHDFFEDCTEFYRDHINKGV